MTAFSETFLCLDVMPRTAETTFNRSVVKPHPQGGRVKKTERRGLEPKELFLKLLSLHFSICEMVHFLKDILNQDFLLFVAKCI